MYLLMLAALCISQCAAILYRSDGYTQKPIIILLLVDGDAARDWLIFALCPKSTLSLVGAPSLWRWMPILAIIVAGIFAEFCTLYPLHIIFANARVYKLLIDGIQLLLAQNG